MSKYSARNENGFIKDITFRPGDRVLVTWGAYKGMTGEVVNHYGYSEGWTVKLDGGPNHYPVFKTYDLKEING